MADFADITAVSRKALQVQKIYYSHLDNPEKRPELLAMYYPHAQHALMQWNGHTLPDPSAIQQYLSTLPKTKHQIRCVDAQPLPGNNNADSFLVTVTGTCVYDDEHVRHFYQRLVLYEHEKRVYIVNDYMRWTGEG